MRMAKLTKAQFLKQAEELIAALRSRIREGAAGKPFDDVSPAACVERRRRGLEDSEYFARTYLPHYLTDETPDFHAEIDELAYAQDEIHILMASRGYAKTTRRTTLHSIRKLCYRLRKNMLIISDTVDKAALHLLPIKVELEINEHLRCDFGEMQGGTWTDEEIITAAGDRMAACSWRQNLRGEVYLMQRPDEAILEDLESRESARSPKQVEKRLAFVREDLLPALVPEGWIVTWIGTPLDAECAIVRAKGERDDQGEPLYVTHEYPAVADGRSIWPARFPLRLLRKKQREMGTDAYLQEFGLVPPSKDNIFRREWFRRNYYERDKLDISELLIVRGVDPSQGIHDLAALLTAGVNTATMDIYFLQVVLRRMSALELIEECVRLDSEIPAHANLIEGNLYRDLLAPILNKRRPGIDFAQVINTQNKELRIRTQASAVELGRYHLDPNVGDSRELENQYVLFGRPGVMDDGPDAGELIHRWVRAGGGKPEYESVRKRGLEDAMRGWL